MTTSSSWVTPRTTSVFPSFSSSTATRGELCNVNIMTSGHHWPPQLSWHLNQYCHQSWSPTLFWAFKYQNDLIQGKETMICNVLYKPSPQKSTNQSWSLTGLTNSGECKWSHGSALAWRWKWLLLAPDLHQKSSAESRKWLSNQALTQVVTMVRLIPKYLTLTAQWWLQWWWWWSWWVKVVCLRKGLTPIAQGAVVL